jgi:hypothetical protein
VCGWHVGDGGRTLTVLLAEPLTHLLESLDDNGQIALTVEEIPSHETYQFKGRYVRHRQAVPDDVETVDRMRRRFVKSVRPIFDIRSDDVINAFVSPPALAVEFEVSEIYLQTPGPGAGTRLIPPMEP